MDFLPNEEQQQIIDTVAQFFAAEHPLAALPQQAGAPLCNQALWQQMAQLGFLGIGQPASIGGSDLSVVEESLLLNEAGKYLLSPSLLGSFLGASVADAHGNRDLAARIVSGDALVALCLATPAQAQGNRIDCVKNQVNGEFQCLEHAGAHYLLFCDSDGAALVENNDSIASNDLDCIDEKIQLSTVLLNHVDSAASVSASACDIYTRATLLRTAYLLGLTETVLQITLDFAGQREQFGQPIGSFQAIKHKCADMALRNEAARATTIQAALQLQSQTADAAFDCAAASVLTSEAAIRNTAECIQIHGAIGFTAEMPVHLLYKRAQLMSQLFASEQALLHRVIDYPAPS